MIVAEGASFYIGALEWWALFGDGPAVTPFYSWGGYVDSCQMAFLTPPMPPGTYPVYVFYGGGPAPSEHEPSEPFGTFTFYEVEDVAVGHGDCRSDYQCEPWSEVCELGMGRCVPAICGYLSCRPCEAVEGCLPEERRCETDADCRLVRSACTCDAVHRDAPVTELTSCLQGACESCEDNVCDREPVEAVCVRGACTERRGERGEAPCAALRWQEEDATLAAGGYLRSPASAVVGDRLGIAWIAPPENPGFRYGALRFAVLEADGSVGVGPVALEEGDTKISQVAVAGGGDGFALAWFSERYGRMLRFQRLSADGAPIGQPRDLDDAVAVAAPPALLPRADGTFELVWAKDDWRVEDGLYRLRLAADGTPLGDEVHVPWLEPDYSDLSIVAVGDAVGVGWQSARYDIDGLWFAHLPLGEAPVHRLSDDGHTVALNHWGETTTAVWLTPAVFTSENMRKTVQVQHFDRDGRPLSAPSQVHSTLSSVVSARVATLGRQRVVLWVEWESGDPTRYRVMARPVDVAGRVLAPTQTLVERWGRYPFVLHRRMGDHILSGWTAATIDGIADEMRFGSWRCEER